MKTNLALATAPPARKPRRASSSAQVAQRRLLQRLGQTWRSLSFQEKSTWVSAAKQINSPSSLTNTPRLTPYLTFTQAAGTLYVATGTVPRTAALPPAYPAPFGDLTLTTSAPGQAFALTLTGPAYAGHILLRAAAPVPAGQTTYPKGAFKTIGTLPGLATSADIAALYLAHYLAPGPGASIAIELIGVSDSGLRTAPTLCTVLTSGPGDALAPTEPALTLHPTK